MRKLILIFYSIILIIGTVYQSGYFMTLKEYCRFKQSTLSSMFLLLIILFVPFFLIGPIFRRMKYKGSTFAYVLPLVLIFVFLKLYYLKRDQLLLNSKVVIDRAIIVEKSNSKFSWYAVSRFKINKTGDSISKYFKINGNLLKRKKIGDTILIKYVFDCPNVLATDYSFSPTREEIEYYKGGRVILPKE
ncbi:hypothetical protein ABHQ57_15165 [Tenacibaculum sp. ZH5_bin.1]|uniref:hypothetical protein n=1 Tax=Tenacibaculum TaxID=104267 RepID=UPI001431B3F3|nr:hypothetical protein [Tenacibaculum mesophilum]KAF9657641.1 hypothetical protein HBA12_10400 [Tenacibaculum mesophilum]